MKLHVKFIKFVMNGEKIEKIIMSSIFIFKFIIKRHAMREFQIHQTLKHPVYFIFIILF